MLGWQGKEILARITLTIASSANSNCLLLSILYQEDRYGPEKKQAKALI
jgi:hypothetical protein